MVENEIQQVVDSLLREQSTYSSLELLLAEGRLIYSDYEAWRHYGERTAGEWLCWWNEFIDLEPELDNRKFPAWLLLRMPGLVKRVEDNGILNNVEVSQLFRLILEILSGSKGEVDSELIEMRRQLKTEHPALFEHYMHTSIGRVR